MKYSKEDMAIISDYVSNFDKKVYIFKNLPPELVSTIFAYVSRSPLGFREILLKMIKEEGLPYKSSGQKKPLAAEKKAAEFQKKWVVGFGHFSIAEHAVINIAIEDISILLTKIFEDNRLASYTEKSTRYQIFDKGHYYKPKRIMNSRYGRIYEKTLDELFDFYSQNFSAAESYFREKFPKKESMSDAYYASYIKGKTCDVLRYVLPAATLTNVAATFNARSLAHAVEKLLSNKLEEAQSLGLLIKEEASKIMPILGSFAEKNPYIEETDLSIANIAKEEFSEEKKEMVKEVAGNEVNLLYYEQDAEDKLVAAIMYKNLHIPFQKVLDKVKKLSRAKKERIFEEFFKRIQNKDEPLREIEHSTYTFEILMDYGAYRDIQRHRICTQTTQLLSTRHGFCVPEELSNFGLKKDFCELMRKAGELYHKIAEYSPIDAQYCVPLAFRKRTLFTMNSRELYHIIKLRSSKAGHKSYRRVAQQMYFELQKVQPLLAKYFAVELD
ncbi:MAG: FAD-dependent thymidylate synthase [Candidatus Diapherotrites archaeon]|nr:FAD-dependent thymidylate synthase [Candidatus Diapherotrites archaeon]